MNFDTTIVGKPYLRIESINIQYTAALTATVEFTEQEHVKLEDGTHRSFGGQNVRKFEIKPEDMTKSVPLLDSNTGQPLGANITYGQVFLGILAVLRAKQAE